MGISSWNRINVTAFLNQRPICGINQLYWVLKEILNILNLWRSVTVNKLSMGLVQRRIKILFYRSYLKTKIFPERRIEIVVLQCYPQEARFLRRLIIARSSYKLFFFKEAFWKMLQLRIAFGKAEAFLPSSILEIIPGFYGRSKHLISFHRTHQH